MTERHVGTAQDGTRIIEVICDTCGNIVTVTGDSTKIAAAIERHDTYYHPKGETR